MNTNSRASLGRLVAGLMVCASACAPPDEDTGAGGSAATVCPESVTLDERGDPRNAAGQVRYCWPSQANCYCDRDGDCYALDGYVPCSPPAADSGIRDSGVIDRGVIDSGPRDIGVVDTGPRDAGVIDRSVVDSGPRDTGAIDSGASSGGTSPGADTVSYSGSLALRVGRTRQSLNVAGLSRPMTVYIPSTRSASPPLMVLFHGTNGGGDEVFTDAGAQAMADRNGVVVIAPDSQWISHGDWDHATEETYWITYPDTDPSRNPDLLLVRAILVEAQRRFNVDPRRVYAVGHSNGGFFTELVATQLASRIAAFATSSAGLVQCATTQSCHFQGRGTTCAQLRTRSGWCSCGGADKPGPVPATTGARVPPGYLAHGTSDPLVSVQYTCALSERLTARGVANTVVLRDGDGHVLPETFATDAWPFLSARTLP